VFPPFEEESTVLDIRRIDEFEAAAVVGLWDQMCAATPNGGPLSDPSRRNLQRMLEIMAWHRDAFCLAAVDPPNVYGFVCARVDPEAGLLPGMIGHVEESYVRRDVPDADGLRRRLVEAAVTVLRNRGARTIRHLIDMEDVDGRELFERLGFEPDMACLSLYETE
jgi:GNAT superfamily N-acetyltransferase